MAPAGYDSVPTGLDWLSDWWDGDFGQDSPDGVEIRLSQFPQWGLTLQRSFFSASWPQVVADQSGLCKWIKKADGTIVVASKPSSLLAVEGDLKGGRARIVVAKEGSLPPQSTMWRIDADGRITLEHSPELGLSVAHGKFESGAAVVLANVTVANDSNKFNLNALGSTGSLSTGRLSTSTPFRLRVVGSCGDPNTLWTSWTGGVSYQQGYVAISQAYRDADSSWVYVTENPHQPQIGTFLQEHWGGRGFLLKAVEHGPPSKTTPEPRYLSCLEDRPTDDKRDDTSSWVYVTKNKTMASVFEEDFGRGGFVLKSGDSHLCCAQYSHRPTEYGSDYTWLYSLKGQRNLAACLAAEPLANSKKEESWWKSFLQKYRKYIQCFCIGLGVLVIIAIIVWATQHSRAHDEQQIIIPYDCNHQPEHMWSDTKVAWCCKHYPPQGCPTTTEPGIAHVPGLFPVPPKTADDDDCFTDVLNWQRDWTISKQNFCCEKHGIACKAAMTTLAFDCNEDYHLWTERWSYRKKLWCCLHHERGCPVTGEVSEPQTFDCADGYSDSNTWDQEKKEWCCYHASVGCPESTAAKYDCEAGFTNWMHGWSEGKKVWCCFHNGRGCSDSSNDDQYDCNAGFENWQVGWSNAKMDFCCQTQQKGCPTQV